MIKNRPLQLAVVIAAILAAGAVEAREQVRTVEVFKGGGVRVTAGRSLAKVGEAFCQSNPNAAFRYVETAGGAAGSRVDEDAGTVSATFNVNLDAMCLPGSTTVRINYGTVAGGTATEGADYSLGSPNPAAVTLANVPQFGGPASGSAALPVTIIDDATPEPDETINFGSLGGAFANTAPGSGSPTVTGISSSGTTLATLTIDDNDDLTNVGGQAGLLVTGDPIAGSVAGALNTICNAPGQDPALIAQCRAIQAGVAAGDAAGVQAALRAIAPEETQTQNATVVELGGAHLDSVGQRLGALHVARNSRRSSGNFALNLDVAGLPVSSLVQSLLQSDDPGNDGAGLLSSPWGIFASATVGGGDRDATLRASGFDFNRFDLNVGADYRFNDTWVGGAAIGYSSLSSDLDNSGGAVDSDAFSLLAYGSYSHPQGTYVDAVVSYTNVNFDQDRGINFSVGGTTVNRTATSSTDSDQFGLDVSVGHAFNSGPWVFTPGGALRYLDTTIDSFQESGAGEFNVAVDEQNLESLVASFSFNVARNFSTASGIVVPYGQVTFNYETEDGADAIAVRLLNDVSNTRFVIVGDSRDSSYGNLDLGVSWVAPGGFQGYVAYTRLFGLEFFQDQAISIGGRWEL